MTEGFTIVVSGALADQLGTSGLGRICQLAADLAFAAVTVGVDGDSEYHKGRIIRRMASPKPLKVDVEEGLRDIETHARAIAKLVTELAKS